MLCNSFFAVDALSLYSILDLIFQLQGPLGIELYRADISKLRG